MRPRYCRDIETSRRHRDIAETSQRHQDIAETSRRHRSFGIHCGFSGEISLPPVRPRTKIDMASDTNPPGSRGHEGAPRRTFKPVERKLGFIDGLRSACAMENVPNLFVAMLK